MFEYPADRVSVVWVVAARVDDETLDVHDGLYFGGWQIGLDDAKQKAKATGETHYVLPCVVTYPNGGAVSRLVRGRMALGVHADGTNARVPEYWEMKR